MRSNHKAQKKRPEGSTQGLSAQYFRSILQVIYQLLPQTHLVDAGYTDAKGLVNSQQTYGGILLGPVAQDASWQAKAGEGFDRASFLVNWETQTVTCPEGRAELFLVAVS
jgi:hypothetical protein